MLQVERDQYAQVVGKAPHMRLEAGDFLFRIHDKPRLYVNIFSLLHI